MASDSGPNHRQGTRNGPSHRARVLWLECVAICPTLRDSLFRPAAWDMPTQAPEIKCLNRGCPWCVHFIYDEYYMANLLSALKSSWESFSGGVLSASVWGKEMECPLLFKKKNEI